MENVTNDNITKLRVLVDELDRNSVDTEDYKKTLYEIESLIKEELSIISKMKMPNNKLKHYENICTGILSMIASTKL